MFINPAANLGPRIQYHEVCYEVLGLGLLSIPRLSQNYTHSQFSVLLLADKHQKEKARLFEKVLRYILFENILASKFMFYFQGVGGSKIHIFYLGSKEFASKKISPCPGCRDGVI